MVNSRLYFTLITLVSLLLVPLFGKAQTNPQIQNIIDRGKEQSYFYPTENRTVSQILSLMNPDGSFSDRAEPDLYTLQERLRKLAHAFDSDPNYQGSQSLKNDIYTAWIYWFENMDPGRNWGDWINTELRMPRYLAFMACVMHQQLSEDLNAGDARAISIKSYLRGVYDEHVFGNYRNSNDAMLGANLSSRFRGAIGIAAVLEDVALLDEVKEKASFMLERGAGRNTQGVDYPHTGLTTDYSFHQHNSQGGQSIWGMYGGTFVDEVTRYIQMVYNTPWDLEPSEYEELYNAIAQGLQFLCYKTRISYAVMGRQCLRHDAQYAGWAYFITNWFVDVTSLSINGLTADQEQHLLDMAIRFSDRHRVPMLDSTKYFFASDMLVHARKNRHLLIRALSKRTAGIEMGIYYNTQNYYMADGATYFHITGDEYEDSRVGWVVSSIPGTTTEQKTEGMPQTAAANSWDANNEFAGGLTDGRNGVMAFDYNKAQDFSTVRAQKGYFLYEDAFAFMGNEVRQEASPNKEIWTTLNQTLWRTDVTYDVGNGQQTVDLNSSLVSDFENVTSPIWFHQDSIGYLIIPHGPIDVKFWAETRNKSWRDLDDTNPSGNVPMNMFHLVINHGTNPQNDKYQYMVVPNISAADFAEVVNNFPITILRNDQDIQAVYHQDQRVAEAVFYNSGESISTPDGIEITPDKPAVMIIKAEDGELSLSVSDPCQKESQINIKVKGSLSGPNVTYNSQTDESTITVNLPQGIEAGMQVDMTFQLSSTSPVATFDYSANSQYLPATVLFDGSESSAPAGSIQEYLWDFGDGNVGNGEFASHTYDPSASDVLDVRLTVLDNEGRTATYSRQLTFEQQPCGPEGDWMTTDVGNVGFNGNTCSEGGEITMEGSGKYLFYEEDEFHFMYQELNGNTDMIVRITQLEYAHHWTKAGIMMRENLTTGSPHAMVGVSPVSWYYQQKRLVQDAGATDVTSYPATVTLPHWVRMSRQGNIFRGYQSTDGINWSLIKIDTVEMPSQIYVGLAVSARDNFSTARAVFDNFSYEGEIGTSGNFPVEFADFTAKVQTAKARVALKWETGSELNNSHFVVQRSQDALAFNDLMTVQGAGNSSTTQKYEAFDTRPLEGQAFYRLKQVDFDGNTSFSDVEEVNYDGAIIVDMALSPNPVDHGQQIRSNVFFPNSESVNLKVMNMAGAVVYQQNGIMLTNDGVGEAVVPTTNLVRGIYMLQMRDEDNPNKWQTQEFIVK